MDSSGHGIFCGSVSPIHKLVRVQGGGAGFDASQNQFLKALSDDWGEYGVEGVEPGCGCIFRDWDDHGRSPAGWDDCLFQRLVIISYTPAFPPT